MANSRGKLEVTPPSLMQMATGRRVAKKPSVGQRDAEYRRFLKIDQEARIPNKIGGGAATGNDAARGARKKVRRRRKPTERPRTTCMKCHALAPAGAELRFGYCPKCWNRSA